MILVISDIHGNLPALNSVLKDSMSYNISKIISLGDVSGYYPFINETIDLLRDLDVINIMGNHDRYIVDNTECNRSSVANVCLDYQKGIITKENISWLKKSLPKYEFKNVSMVHGGWKNNEDEYIYKVRESYFNNLPYGYFFCGHTHVQKFIKLNDSKFFINPGAVGQPRDGIPLASYCIFDLEKEEVLLKRVKYDISVVAKKMEELGFDERIYQNLYNGTRIGGRIDRIERVI